MDISTLNAYNPYLSSLTTAIYQPLLLQQQAINTLNQTSASYQTQISDYGQILNAVSALQSAGENLIGSFALPSYTANSSAPNVLSASAGTGSSTGTYNIQVSQLAQGETLVSSPQPSANAAIGSGTPTSINFQFANGASQNVTIDGTDNTLSGMAAAINNANIGVSAFVVQNGSSYELTLTGQTGTSNAFTVSASPNGDAAVSALLTYQTSGPANGLSQTETSQDARGTFNGAVFSSSSNVATDVSNGLTLNLAGTGSAAVTVSPDVSQLTNAVQSFVTTYNQLQTMLGNYASGDLSGDATLPVIQSQFASAINTTQSGLSGSYNALSQIGITTNPDGTLSLDTQAFQNAASTSASNVAQIFTNNGAGAADQILSQARSIADPYGLIPSTVSALQTQMRFSQDMSSSLTFGIDTLHQGLANQYSQLEAMLATQSSDQTLLALLAQAGSHFTPSGLMVSSTGQISLTDLAAQYKLLNPA